MRILWDYTVALLPSYKCCPLKGDRLLVTTWAIVQLVKHPSVTRTRCFYAVNTADLCSYALHNLVGTHRCPSFVHPARMQSTLLTCVHTHCRTSLVHTAVLHSYMLCVCHHYRWLHSYALLVYRQHRRSAFVRIAEHRCYPVLSYIRRHCSSAVYIVDLRSYTLQKLVGMPCSPTFVRAARMQSTPLTCLRTHCRTSSVGTAVLHSYMLHICRHYRWLHSYILVVCRQNCRPAFVRIAEHCWYTLRSYIRTCCVSTAITVGYIRKSYSSAVNIVNLCSYALQTLLLPTAVLHSYVLLVCHIHCRPAIVHIAEVHW